MVALEVCAALGVSPDPVVEVEFSRWRSQESELPGGGLLINDAWNANPVAMKAALALSPRPRRREAHGRDSRRDGGARCSMRLASTVSSTRAGGVVVGVGELARAYGPDEWAASAAEATELARQIVRAGDACS